jgi:cupredoxin-like protein
VRVVLAVLDSSRVILAVVFGIPLAVGMVVGLGVRRRTPAVVLLAGIVMVAGVSALAIWAVFRQPAQQPSGFNAMSPGPGGPAGSPLDLSCAPSGAQLQEVAKGIAFEKTCLAAPADQQFTIEFDNQDPGTPHNIHIFSADPNKDPNARSLFGGEPVTGPKKTAYQVPPLPAGRYFFHCDIHPAQMFGGFVVGGP